MGLSPLKDAPRNRKPPLLFSTRGLDPNRLFPPTILKISWRADWICDSTRLQGQTLIVIGEPCGGFSGISIGIPYMCGRQTRNGFRACLDAADPSFLLLVGSSRSSRLLPSLPHTLSNMYPVPSHSFTLLYI